MLDIKFIRENLEKVKTAAKNKNREVDFEKLLDLDEKHRSLTQEVEKVRAERNVISQQRTVNSKQLTDNSEQRTKGRELKEQLKRLEEGQKKITEELNLLLLTVPNVPHESVPVGKDASGNKEVAKWGNLPKFDFPPKDHITLAKDLDLVDFDRGVKVGGFRQYFLKNEGALLEMAVLTHAYRKIAKKGYIPLVAPSIVKEFTLLGNGQFPWGREEVYHLEKDNMYLAGTAEVPVTAYFSGEVLDERILPKKFVAFSSCFRREAGSYGKDTKGLYRLHQFNKVEQVIVTNNEEKQSLEFLEELRKNSEEILQDLELPYRVLLMCTGDMGEPQVKKYDIETWMPSRNAYGETMSDSFMGDFQARRLNIRYRTGKNVLQFCHTLNNTAIASPRILIAIFENCQREDGSITVPKVLQDFVGTDVITKR
ncbi:serine--tRNA ligase [Candidatus Gottesmanbacteria bacterium]|nr:serine--tRNA ligase [Candidatus Gottesmanbacteria bacterium]